MKILPKLEASVPSANSKGVAEADKGKEPEVVVEAEAEEKKPELEREEELVKENSEQELTKAGQSTLVDFAK